MLQAELERLKSLLRPGNPAEISNILGRLAVHCPMRNLNSAQVGIMMDDYMEDLMGYSNDHIAQGAKAYRMNPENVFFPTLPVLLAQIRQITFPICREIQAIERILAAVPETKREPTAKLDLSGIGKEPPQFTHEQMVQNTIRAMRENGAPESHIEEFIASS